MLLHGVGGVGGVPDRDEVAVSIWAWFSDRNRGCRAKLSLGVWPVRGSGGDSGLSTPCHQHFESDTQNMQPPEDKVAREDG